MADAPPPLHPAYFETHFRVASHPPRWPHSFAIISGYARTGEVWTADENARADAELGSALQAMGAWLHRITGFSPVTGHAEPSWAAELSLDGACELGERFRQDAIYLVQGDRLSVVGCAEPRQGHFVDSFIARLQDGD